MTDHPTDDDLPARLDKMADLSASPAYAVIHRAAAARIRELEAAGDALADAAWEDEPTMGVALDHWYRVREGR